MSVGRGPAAKLALMTANSVSVSVNVDSPGFNQDALGTPHPALCYQSFARHAACLPRRASSRHWVTATKRTLISSETAVGCATERRENALTVLERSVLWNMR